MFQLIVSVSIIMLVLCGWVIIQHVARNYASKHPEQGPYRDEGSCCGSCSCGKSGKS